MDEGMLGAAVQGQDHAVGPALLVDRPAGHLLVDVALVDDDRVAHLRSRCRRRGPGSGPRADQARARRRTGSSHPATGCRSRRRPAAPRSVARIAAERSTIGEPADRSRRGAVGGRSSTSTTVEPSADTPTGIGSRPTVGSRHAPVDRPDRPTEAGLDDEVLDEAVRALRGDRDEMTPGRVRDAERQLDELLARCSRGSPAGPVSPGRPTTSQASPAPETAAGGVAADGAGEAAGRAAARPRERRCRGRPTLERRPGARGDEDGDRDGQRAVGSAGRGRIG